MDQLQQLPFQVQVTYTAADGSKAMRVLTQLKETTDNREVAEVNAVRSVIAENHIRSTANDMMVTVADEEDDEYYTASSSRLMRTKYATPVVQKQRLAYMDNLNTKVRSRTDYETDRFNERFAKNKNNQVKIYSFIDVGIKQVMIYKRMLFHRELVSPFHHEVQCQTHYHLLRRLPVLLLQKTIVQVVQNLVILVTN